MAAAAPGSSSSSGRREGQGTVGALARQLAEAHTSARNEVRLLTAVGGAGGFIIGRATARTFLPPSAPWGVPVLATLGLLGGALATGRASVGDRVHLWDRATWHPDVRRSVEALEAAKAAAKESRQQPAA